MSHQHKYPAMRTWLVSVAKARSKVFYGEMITIFDIDRFSLRRAMEELGHQSKNLGEPIITALIVLKSTGRCADGLTTEFGDINDEEERRRLYEYWGKFEDGEAQTSPTEHELVDPAIRFAISATRPDQAAFRKSVFGAYNGRCVVSGCDIAEALDAAHKQGRDWKKGHNKAEDGFLLRKDLHALYDKKLLSIEGNGRVTLHPMALNHFGEFDGKTICPFL